MNEIIAVTKDENGQRPIPSVWRPALVDIVDAFKDADFGLARGIAGVGAIPVERAARIAKNIENYGARLTSLPEESWQTSVCQWMLDYWDVLVDLFTVEEGASDLVLALRVFEHGEDYIFEVQSVHVP